MQEEKLKRPLSHMEAWEIAHTQKDSKPGSPKYYGKKTALGSGVSGCNLRYPSE